MSARASPTQEDQEELILSSRYGDLDDVRQFVNKYGAAALTGARDDNGNTVLHMASANGHTELLDFALSLVPPALLSAQNNSGSTALHWAALNAQLDAAHKLVELPNGPGANLIDIKNTAGRSPLGEAELAGWDEGAKWMVEVMKLEGGPQEEQEDIRASDVADVIEVEIEDADGEVAKMSLGTQASPSPSSP